MSNVQRRSMKPAKLQIDHALDPQTRKLQPITPNPAPLNPTGKPLNRPFVNCTSPVRPWQIRPDHHLRELRPDVTQVGDNSGLGFRVQGLGLRV